MPELRRDPVTGMGVVVAPGRAHRPHSFPGTDTASCPFCPGNEHMTPPEVARIGPGPVDGPGWQVRVFPNLYPVVVADGVGIAGDHEVIVLSPDHHRQVAALDDVEVTAVFRALRERVRAHGAAGRAHVLPFMNQGQASGASVEHPHAQLVSLDHVPPVPAALMRRFATAGEDLLAAQLEIARRDGLVVLDDPRVAVWCPPAPTQAFEFVVAAPDVGSRIDQADDEHLAAVAIGVRKGLAALEHLLGEISTTTVVETAPVGASVTVPDSFRWHVRVYPRLSVQGGFEFGSGYLSNALTAEDAARALRYGVAALAGEPATHPFAP